MRELRDRLELELLQQGGEKYECVLKRKQQQVAEVLGQGGRRVTTKPIPHPVHDKELHPKPVLPLPAANRQDDGAGQRETGCRAEDPQGDLREV